MNLKALHDLTYGMYIIGSRKSNSLNAQTANTVIQVCSDPVVVSVCINKGNLTHEFIKDSGVFSVSILSRDAPLSHIGAFGFRSGRDVDKLKGVNYRVGETGAPIVLDYALSYLEVKVAKDMDLLTHTTFVGEVVAAEVLRAGEPLTYAYYHAIKRGTTPTTAPSYVKETQAEGVPAVVETKGEERPARMDKYRCIVCGYVYDPKEGDPDSNIPPGVPFESLPDNWVCPVCGATKVDFEKVE
ncbi:MAG: rubredoxin [Chloroflexi bacterium]|nr:rubredoxin [Chloroflexota bacterium]